MAFVMVKLVDKDGMVKELTTGKIPSEVMPWIAIRFFEHELIFSGLKLYSKPIKPDSKIIIEFTRK